MRIRQGVEEKSRLGRLLVNRGYLSEGQVEDGLKVQRETGQRLGEVFIQAGWITEKELDRVLKHQSRYRNAAALVTMVTLPFQPMVTLAAGNNANATQGSTQAGELYQAGNLAPLTEAELAAVSGQGDPSLLDRVRLIGPMASQPAGGDGEPQSPEADVIEGLKLTANILIPVLNFLESDLSISGVHYREGEPRYSVREDGALVLAFPERIEEIRMDNIRVSSNQGASLGNVSIQDIRFHPDSRMTIYTR